MTPQEIEDLAAQYPGPVSISLRPPVGRARSVFMIVLIALMVMILVVPGTIVVTRAMSPWDGGAFGFGAIYLIAGIVGIGCLAGARPVVSLIVLDRDGFTMTSGPYIRHARWNDVADFRVKGILSAWPMLRFRNASPSARLRVCLGLGRDSLRGLPMYNAPLANLLNDWRERALAERPRAIEAPLPPIRA